MGAAGARGAGGRVAGAEGVEKKATRARKPIVLLALFCTRAGDWGKMDTVERADGEKAAHPEEVVYSGRGP